MEQFNSVQLCVTVSAKPQQTLAQCSMQNRYAALFWLLVQLYPTFSILP